MMSYQIFSWIIDILIVGRSREFCSTPSWEYLIDYLDKMSEWIRGKDQYLLREFGKNFLGQFSHFMVILEGIQNTARFSVELF